jgi:hypothetical protein
MQMELPAPINSPSGVPACGRIKLALLLGLALGGSLITSSLQAQSTPTAKLRNAAPIRFRGANSPSPAQPGDCDCNCPAHWEGETLYVFNSAGHPWRLGGPDVLHLDQSYLRTEYNNRTNGGRWIECTWKAEDGVLYGWYHLEPTGLVPGTGLTAPRIGAVCSTNNGALWQDLGIVLEAPPGTLKPDTKNFYFAGGNGDFSIMVDAARDYLYFLISTYAGELAQQGVSVARMRYADRNQPVGKVWKWHQGGWTERGVGGKVTPVFPALINWHLENADAFWGPSIHWNSHLQQYVILLNRAKDYRWAQEGVYVTFNPDLANPNGWSQPRKILDGLRSDQWYPVAIGLDQAKRETDKLAGRVARLFMRGESRWEILFLKPGEKE